MYFATFFYQKNYLLQLYQALHPEDKNVTESDLEYVTLQNIMINADYNDLGFLGKTVTEAVTYLTKRFGFSEARSQKEIEKYWNA